MKKYDLALVIFAVFVIILVSSVFNITGNPLEKQQKAADQQIIQNFSTISSAITDYYTRNKQLPQQLKQINTSSYVGQEAKNAINSNKYDYQITSPISYNLCATFQSQSNNTPPDDYRYQLYPAQSSAHNKGYDCLNYSIPTTLIPTPTPTIVPKIKSSINSPIVQFTSIKSQNSGTSASWSHSNTQPGNIIIVTAAYHAHNNPQAAIESVTFNSQPFKKVRRDHHTDRSTEIWYLLNPAITTSSITVQFSQDPEAQSFSAATISDIDLSDPLISQGGSGTDVQEDSTNIIEVKELKTEPNSMIYAVFANYPDGGANQSAPRDLSGVVTTYNSPDLNIQNITISRTASSANDNSVAMQYGKGYSRSASYAVFRSKLASPSPSPSPLFYY